ncbi:MAG: DNA/RNA nuclease SfsA [bacterium]|nr:DNA/RNA nuclease SfsA [bacterium]
MCVIPYPEPLVEGILLKRYKRFLADVQLYSGEIVIAHCPNPGRMTSCLFVHEKIRLLPTPKNKLKYRWVQSYTPYGWAGIDTMLPNELLWKALQNGSIQELKDTKYIRKEYQVDHSRFDFFLPYTEKEVKGTLIEVKSVTWYDESGFLFFPDAPSKRAVKHLQTMIEFVQSKKMNGVVIYLVQHPKGNQVLPAAQIDPLYARVAKEAVEIGIKFFTYRVHFTQNYAALDTNLLA